MKWLNKRKPVYTQTVFGFPQGKFLDYIAHTHWVNHRKWKHRNFMPGSVYDILSHL